MHLWKLRKQKAKNKLMKTKRGLLDRRERKEKNGGVRK
jgi:hypothetical protein